MLNQAVAGSDDLYTTVRNMTEAERFFGFLPPHGRTLGAGEEFSFFGTLDGYLNRRVVRDRSRRSLETALANGTLSIIKTTGVILYDPTLDQSKRLDLDGRTLVVTDPSWGAYSSSDIGGPGHVDN